MLQDNEEKRKVRGGKQGKEIGVKVKIHAAKSRRKIGGTERGPHWGRDGGRRKRFTYH